MMIVVLRTMRDKLEQKHDLMKQCQCGHFEISLLLMLGNVFAAGNYNQSVNNIDTKMNTIRQLAIASLQIQLTI